MGVVRPRRQRGRGGVEPHLLVRLHLAADHPEGVGGGVVIDLDAAEGLRARAGGQPALVAVIIEHHRGPAGAHNRLAAERRAGARGRGQLAVGSLHPPPRGRSPSRSPGRFTDTKSVCQEEGPKERKRKTDRERGLRTGPQRDPDRGTGGEKDGWDDKRQTGRDRQIDKPGDVRQTRKETDSQTGSKRQEEDESDRLEEANIQTDDGEREVRKGVRLLQGRRTEMDRETEMWRES